MTPFIHGGLDASTITDVVVVNLTQDHAGDIVGYSRMARITTSLEPGAGSYFPAFLPDGNLFYLANAVPKKSESDKRFYFKVVDPSAELMMANVFAGPEAAELASSIAKLWQSACSGSSDINDEAAKDHEAPWILSSPARRSRRIALERGARRHGRHARALRLALVRVLVLESRRYAPPRAIAAQLKR